MTRLFRYTTFSALAMLVMVGDARAMELQRYWIIYIYGPHAPYPQGIASLPPIAMFSDLNLAHEFIARENSALHASANNYVNACNLEVFPAKDEKDLRTVIHHRGHPIWPEGLEHWGAAQDTAMRAAHQKGKRP